MRQWATIDENGKFILINSKFISSDGLSFKRTKDALFPLKKGDLVMVMSDVPKGKALAKCFLVDADNKYTLNQRICAIRTNNFDLKFLCYQLNRNKHFLEFDNGENQTNLRKNDILDCPLLVPPLSEQIRIVAILDEAFAAIAKAKANAEQNLKNAKELFESYLQGVFENKGEDWEERSLEDIVDEKCSLSYGIVQPGEEYSDGLPVIRPTDLTSKFINLNGLKRIDPKLADGYKRTKLIGDELLLCVRGTTGVVSIALKELEGANVTRGIVPIRFNSKIIDQGFGYYLLTSGLIQKQIKEKTYGAALMQINIGDLRKIQTLYPRLIEQQAIVLKLDSLFSETKKLEVIYQQKIESLDELKKSILQKAFTGELTGKLHNEAINNNQVIEHTYS
ncbi:MAG: restriction endonuclease subunit S [Chitinophagaceae bacterium]|nr:MAG: restriction endonuclease subunit S [Chitinophagaceae bacterium]